MMVRLRCALSAYIFCLLNSIDRLAFCMSVSTVADPRVAVVEAYLRDARIVLAGNVTERMGRPVRDDDATDRGAHDGQAKNWQYQVLHRLT